MNYKLICIFTQNGKTYTFNDITIIASNESVIHFSYLATSDGKQKVATFFKSAICGYSLTKE